MTSESFLSGQIKLYCGDSRDILKVSPDCSVDALVTDPPYALVSIQKRFGKPGAAPAKGNDAYMRASSGFMSVNWDTGETAFASEFWQGCLRVLKPGGHIAAFGGTRTFHRLVCAIEDSGAEIRDCLSWNFGSGFPKSHNIGDGWGTALKPAMELICLARKPLSEKTVAANVLRWGTGAINVDGCRVPTEEVAGADRARHSMGYRGGNEGSIRHAGSGTSNSLGRWPANVVLDGREEVVAAFPDAPGQQGALTGNEPSPTFSGSHIYGSMARTEASSPRDDSGSAARFFYTAKADADDRLGSKHPTVKPVDLMQWLCRLVTPRGGTILDPFAGTGTTGEAAFREGFNAILIEREVEYQADIRRRMALCMSGPDERKRESVKAKLGDVPFEPGSLFATPEAAE